MQVHYLDPQMLVDYQLYLQEEERAEKTLQKYVYDIRLFYRFCGQEGINKERTMEFKRWLMQRYSAVSANSMLVAVNGFLAFLGWYECRVRLMSIQRSLYRDPQKQLTRQEYYRLVETAKCRGDERLALLMQTICATGIRVSEVSAITVRAVNTGRAEVTNKGKKRIVYLPQGLCAKLKRYCQKHGHKSGAVFVTRSGQPIDRSNIWHMMKTLAKAAGVAAGKVFPHNLRHLFAECYYRANKDLDHLASILGHSNINTTRIYTQTTGEEFCKEVTKLRLLL